MPLPWTSAQVLTSSSSSERTVHPAAQAANHKTLHSITTFREVRHRSTKVQAAAFGKYLQIDQKCLSKYFLLVLMPCFSFGLMCTCSLFHQKHCVFWFPLLKASSYQILNCPFYCQLKRILFHGLAVAVLEHLKRRNMQSVSSTLTCCSSTTHHREGALATRALLDPRVLSTRSSILLHTSAKKGQASSCLGHFKTLASFPVTHPPSMCPKHFQLARWYISAKFRN